MARMSAVCAPQCPVGAPQEVQNQVVPPQSDNPFPSWGENVPLDEEPRMTFVEWA